MSELLFFVILAMNVLAPNRDHSSLANAITNVAVRARPLFAYDYMRVKTISLMISVAFKESSFRNNAVGDHGRALCAFQLWNTSRDVLDDAELCTSIALERMRESIKACGVTNALGLYAAGPGGCESPHAKRISRDRMALAKVLAGGEVQR